MPKQDDKPRLTRKAPRLGRGLSSLMAHPVAISTQPTPPPESPPKTRLDNLDLAKSPSPPVSKNPAQDSATHPSSEEKLVHLPIVAIRINPYQPRQKFDQDSLSRLAQSIRIDGLMQPIVVRRYAVSSGSQPASGNPQQAYELVAGERRWRAAQLASLTSVPAIVKDLNDQQMAEWSLIENLQREDLNPMERAQAFQTLQDRFQLSQDQIAQRVGLDRSTISNLLRLLSLCEDVQQWIRDGLLSVGQAKPLAAIADEQAQKNLAQKAIAQAMTARQVERLAKQFVSLGSSAGFSGGGSGGSSGGEGVSGSISRIRPLNHLNDLEAHIGQQLGTKVHLRQGRKKGSGTIAIEFYSLDQFDTLLERFGVTTDY